MIGGAAYHFDPSFKPHTRKPALDLAKITGYSQAALLATAKSGATVTTDYVQGINRAAIRTALTGYANKLSDHLRANAPAARIEDVVGGLTIVPQDSGKLRQTRLPHQSASYGEEEWAAIPDTYRPMLRVVYQGIDRTFTSDAIYGHRLSISYDEANQPLLKLDGTVLATGAAIARGTPSTVQFAVWHPAYGDKNLFVRFDQTITAGGTYVIGNAWGPATRGVVEHHRAALEKAKAEGQPDTAEAVLGASLAMLSSSWIAQANQSYDLMDRVGRLHTILHRQVGIAGHYTAPYVDLPGNLVSILPLNGDGAMANAAFYNGGMHASIFESTVVQQTTGGSAVSTVKLIDMAVAANEKIYSATATNYQSVARSLVGCGAYDRYFQQALADGSRLILPGRCTLTENSWTGLGYYDLTGDSIGAVISGGFYGGFGTTPQPPSVINDQARINVISPIAAIQNTGNSYGDPIDITKGNFLYDNTDLAAGQGAFPASLPFQRLYSSGARQQAGPLGRGWTHSLAASIAINADGHQGMGEDAALDAVTSLVEVMVSLDLLSDTAKPLDKMVIATVGQRWFADQLLDNTVVVRQGLTSDVFVKLPDGSYNPPPGNASRLIKNADGSVTLETANRTRLDFNTAGELAR